MGHAEQEQLLTVARRLAGGRLLVIACCTACATRTAEEMAVTAAAAGATGLLCSPPPYCKPTQDGIFMHIRAIAHTGDLLILLYHNPVRAGVAIADERVARLFRAGLIGGIKDATGGLARPMRLRALCGPELAQLSGDDATAAAHRAMGGIVGVLVVANVAPQLCAVLHRAWDRGNIDMFERMRDLLAPHVEALVLEPNPIPIKAALAGLGNGDRRMRLPLTRARGPTATCCPS